MHGETVRHSDGRQGGLTEHFTAGVRCGRKRWAYETESTGATMEAAWAIMEAAWQELRRALGSAGDPVGIRGGSKGDPEQKWGIRISADLAAMGDPALPLNPFIILRLDFKDWKWMVEAVHRFDFPTTLDFYLQKFSLEFYLHEEHESLCPHPLLPS